MSALLLALSDPRVLLAILGIIGSIVGFFIKRWMAEHDATAIAQKDLENHETASDHFETKLSDQTAEESVRNRVQSGALTKWFDDPKF